MGGAAREACHSRAVRSYEPVAANTSGAVRADPGDDVASSRLLPGRHGGGMATARTPAVWSVNAAAHLNPLELAASSVHTRAWPSMPAVANPSMNDASSPPSIHPDSPGCPGLGHRPPATDLTLARCACIAATRRHRDQFGAVIAHAPDAPRMAAPMDLA